MSYQLTIDPIGAIIEVAEGQTVLDAALRQGIYLPHACCHGLCGTCKVQVCDGEVDHGHANPFALMEFEREEGKALACCATLHCDTTIEADIDEEPDGRFFVRRSAPKPRLFMAGGSGLSSPRSMILDLLEGGSTEPITLVYGQRSRDELYYDAEFRALARKHADFTYVPALSGEGEGSNWAGARGFVHDAAKAHFGASFAGQQAYLCGPPPMVEACIATLMQGRLFERDIYTEKFLSAADAQGARSPLFRRG